MTAPRNARHDPRSARRHTIPHSALTDPFETHNLTAPSHSSAGTVGMTHSQRDGTPFHTQLSLTPLRLTTLPLPHTAPPVQYATYSVAVSGIVIPIATKPMPCTIVVPRRPKDDPTHPHHPLCCSGRVRLCKARLLVQDELTASVAACGRAVVPPVVLMLASSTQGMKLPGHWGVNTQYGSPFSRW